jgi:hypothetical protein
MNNVIWKTKYSIYPFEYPNGISGEMKVKDKGGI